MDMETLKILIPVLCVVAFGVWGAWVALRAEERKEAAEKKSGRDQPPLPDA